MVEVAVGRRRQLQCAEADVVESLVVDAERLVRVLDELVDRQSRVVRLDHHVRHLQSRPAFPLLYSQKKSSTIPGLSRTPTKNFPGPFRSLQMFKCKEKTAFTYNIQSVVHCRKFSKKQNADVSCSEFRSTYSQTVSIYMQ